MGSLNKVQLIGYLGRDAELRYTQGGAGVASFNMATTEVWNDKGGQRQEKTEWHRCVLFGKSAESLAEYLKKGKQIYAEGRLQTRKWQDREGNEKYTTEIIVGKVVLLSSGGGGGGRRQERTRDARTERADQVIDDRFGGGDEEQPVGAAAGGGDTPFDDDIPF